MTAKLKSRRYCNIVFIVLIFLSSLILISCGKKKQEEYNGYYIFGLDANGTKVLFEKYTPKAKETSDIVKEFIERMKKEPDDIAMKKAIPDDVTVDDYNIGESGELSLYLNAAYADYEGVSSILRRAAIVKTLCQIPDISGVQMYVSGQPLVNSNMDAVGIMTADTFIDNTGGEKSYKQTTTLNMYFADKVGTSLVEVPVEITYDASISLEQLAIEQLLKGPSSITGISDNNVNATLPDGTKLNKISVKENTCYIDFSTEFLDKRKNITPEVAIYSVVNTLVELPGINKVQFSIAGKQVLKYSDTVNFGEPFERNLDLVSDTDTK